MSDPLSVSASILGIVGVTTQIVKLFNDYVGSIRSAPEEAQTLKTEVLSIHSVLQQVADFLDDASDEISVNFAKNELLSKTTVQLQVDQKNLLSAIETLKQLMGSATQDLLSKSDDISRELSLVSDLAESNNEKLQKISDAVEDVQETLEIVKDDVFPRVMQ
ncbi:Similar to hypothetical protein NECHADRAFT_97213 [Nectria haematococca mpVI 77-13-4]; acc. no. XP_003042333 [Pyronema omphalodes CBS 100304]|uniref:Azaphilone pigments biosynthesis cluster protein L N-terminal domain-containing protein n=1 Tax=Pyronema omphalodes (strain CBS 100304) TaxID=1076935 RepID=U4LPL0_PYROM|nr:Similar to hypothetical protein NECHADRAFT_97213 [Nectria haematococca mpVI 77-13-4]; acc. no. XP_003042333 [Pyronema omphalodes CBS 100304]